MRLDPDDLETTALRERAAFAGRRVLEIGAGDGRLGLPFAAEAAHWVALDTDHAELLAADQISLRRVTADARRLPFPDAAFDLVFFSYALC